MMDAERLHLQALVKQRAHEIEWQECQIFIENIRKLGTMGTYLTGIAFTALYMTNIYVHDVAASIGMQLHERANGSSATYGSDVSAAHAAAHASALNGVSGIGLAVGSRSTQPRKMAATIFACAVEEVLTVLSQPRGVVGALTGPRRAPRR